jgi:hypothetical protein
VVLDLDDDDLRVVGVAHDHVHALDLQQRARVGGGAVELAERVPAPQLAGHAGRGEGVAQHSVVGEEVVEHDLFASDHPAHVLHDLTRAATHLVLLDGTRIGTVTPFRRYGTRAPFGNAHD